MSKRRQLAIRHYVPGEVAAVFAAFDRELFERLAPKFPPSRLLRYDGNDPGDEVHIELGIPPLTQLWISEIIAREVSDERASFVDVGRRLPVPLSYWRHRHLIEAAGPGRVVITEDISFGTPSGALSALLEPFVRSMFEARGPAYYDFFSASSVG